MPPKPRIRKNPVLVKPIKQTRGLPVYRSYYSKEFKEFLGQNKGILDKIWGLAGEFEKGLGYRQGAVLRNEITREVRLKDGFLKWIKISPANTGNYRGERNSGTFKVEVDKKVFFVKLFRTSGDVDQIKSANDLRAELKKRSRELGNEFPDLNFEVLNYHFGHPGKPPELPGIIIAEFLDFFASKRVHEMLQNKDNATRELGFSLQKKIDQLSKILGNKWHLASHNAIYNNFTGTLTFFDVRHG
ncbi:MAG: hypothetical protein Q7K42_04650 [Candidatus Diapherotrites archaeon]|nr:hypothetical protein [Candidatus Diapherotrites archaeon]